MVGGQLGVGCWVLGVGCWVLGVGCWAIQEKVGAIRSQFGSPIVRTHICEFLRPHSAATCDKAQQSPI